ncbi:AbrB/MazE/SpoVT family DNA-binding domain-containing protein [Tenggerimyces flavus]|uniref:AbrB/MazE/SpoVT family DNA-binding domain-containing protein n=1 Tax=Tenggerimyces flavus TaxID=1708749 RepID=A0ABV7YC77_9ACTN|nr:AbrB/MazE/SpoVT family DNA-binding domain-containing protein [Tenggerimyces flavus]MBM7787031.1 AbrB family looped-hinge helix DNA binding protein [Tenggerimyces flavus]
MEKHVAFAAVQPKNGTVTIPAQVRREFGLDKPGAQVEIIVRDGEIVLVPHLAVRVDETWFWSKEWQAKEREVDEELAAGRRTRHETSADFLAHLDRLDEATDEA